MLKLRVSVAVTTALCAVVVSSCNALTGADDLVIAGESGTPATPPLVAAPGVMISEIAIYQGVKIPLMTGGMPVTPQTPIVIGRDAMLRVFVTTDASYDGEPVTARLSLSEAGTPIEVTATVAGASNEGDLNSTFNIDIAGASITESFQYSVLLGQVNAAGENPGAVYPASGLQPVGAQSTGPGLKVQLIPVQYAADGSNRVPDTSPEQLQLYRDAFFGTYPAASVEISVHAPLVWNQTISAFGGGWDTLLNHVSDMRQSENTPLDVYYYGIFNPTDSFDQFCNGGCVLGLGNLGDAGDNYTHAAIGIGWASGLNLTTSIHEIGHTHGRHHAPCGGASGVDPSYPYSGGDTGVWGYDLTKKTLLQPTTADFMGYCEPMWVSDYTYKALFDRIKTVNNAFFHFPPETLNRTYDRVMIGQDGSLKWIAPIKMKQPPMAETTAVVLEAPAGDRTVEGQLYRYDHLAGGVLFWPQTGATYTAMRVNLDGKPSRIVR